MKRLALALSMIVLAPAAQAADCSADSAVYEMADSNEATLTLSKRAEPSGFSDLEIVVTTPQSPERFSFWLTASNGYGNLFAIPDDENLSDDGLIVFFFQKDGDRLKPYGPELPDSDAPEPDAIFLPLLGSVLWYGTNGGDNAVSIRTQIWYLAKCG